MGCMNGQIVILVLGSFSFDLFTREYLHVSSKDDVLSC